MSRQGVILEWSERQTHDAREKETTFKLYILMMGSWTHVIQNTLVARRKNKGEKAVNWNFWHANFIKIIRKPWPWSHTFLFTTIKWREKKDQVQKKQKRNRMKQALLLKRSNRDDNTRNLYSIMATCTADCCRRTVLLRRQAEKSSRKNITKDWLLQSGQI